MLASLPTPFLSMMQRMLNEAEYAAFLESYKEKRALGFRIHPKKIHADPTYSLPFNISPIPWCEDGFYYSENDFPGRHPYHAAGLYYIQEPSAMAVAECLGVDESSVVLDLCAAPGGKSTQIASKLGKDGLLIANEIHPARAKILSENLERWGSAQTIVLNETPQKLQKHFQEFFTHILVDAPCSGEGMFRKDPDAREHWSPDAVQACVERQKEILACAIPMLQPGCVLVYSTCTFNPFENEQMMEWILTTFPDCILEPLPIANYIDHGQPEWTNFSFRLSVPGGEIGTSIYDKAAYASMEKTGRLWPHHLKGEGHFVARIRKSPDSSEIRKHMGETFKSSESSKSKPSKSCKSNKSGKIPQASRKIWEAFVLDTFHVDLEDPNDWNHMNWMQSQGISEQAGLVLFGDHLYLCPSADFDFSGLKVVRPGVYLGEVKANRFEPGHGLALSVDPKRAKRIVDLPSSGQEILSYLRGESIHIESERGWTLMAVDGYPIGFAKSDGKTLKNHYPKGLRWNK